MKIAICDICVAEGKLQVAKYRMRDKIMGMTVMYCSHHKPMIENTKSTDKLNDNCREFARILVDADNGYNQLLAQA